MGFLFINSVEGKAISNPVTSAMDTLTAGVKLLVAHVCDFNLGTFNDDDTGANFWTPLTRRSALTPKSQIHYVINPKLHAAHTFKVTGASLFASVIVQAFTATGVITFDQEATNEATSSTIQPGSITPPRNRALFICGHGTAAEHDHSIDLGFTETNEVPFSGSNWEGSSLSYLIQVAAAALNPTWSGGGAGDQQTANMAVFLEATGAMRSRQQLQPRRFRATHKYLASHEIAEAETGLGFRIAFLGSFALGATGSKGFRRLMKKFLPSWFKAEC